MNKSAFPFGILEEGSTGPYTNEMDWGMELRDYFAIRFAAALYPHSTAPAATLAKMAYNMADAMMNQREKTP